MGKRGGRGRKRKRVGSSRKGKRGGSARIGKRGGRGRKEKKEWRFGEGNKREDKQGQEGGGRGVESVFTSSTFLIILVLF